MSQNNDKEPKAAALKYDRINTPTVVAKGSGQKAREIIQLALENDVHIHEDPHLVEVLSRLELGDEIPEQLYLAIAKIIAFAYFLQSKHPKGYSPGTRQTEENLMLDSPQPRLDQPSISPPISDETKD